MAAVPAPGAVPAAAAAAAAGGSGNGGGKPGRSSRADGSSPAVNPGQGGVPGDTSLEQHHHHQQPQPMRGSRSQVPQQYVLQQQGSGPERGGPVGSPMAGSSEPTRALYIGNLAGTVDEAALQHTFGGFGPIMHLQVGGCSSCCVARLL